MASSDQLEDVRSQVSNKITALTEDVVGRLSELWFQIYDVDIVEENIRLLHKHVDNLYVDIMKETVKRKLAVEEDVKRLLKEASDLGRLLSINDIDLSQKEGVPLHSFMVQLNESLDSLRTQLKERHDEIEELLVQQNDICQDLGETARPLGYDPLPSAGELKEFRLHLQELIELREKRVTESKSLRLQIRECLDLLELENLPSDDQKLVDNSKQMQYSKHNVVRLNQILERLQNKCHDLRTHIDQTKDKVRNLWKCLEVEQEHRDSIERNVEYHRTAYDLWRQEFDRCETEKRANLKRFVDKVRQELLIMWEKTLKADDEKRRFKYFTSDVYSDDLIRIHEIELEELNQFYDENEEIFQLIGERKLLWARMCALEEKANAPNRYNNRGGQLLREEKERKTIAHKLPKIENDLRQLVEAFEERTRKKFTVYGVDLVEMIEQDWAEKKAEKQKFMSARKKDPQSTTMLTTPARRPTTPGPAPVPRTVANRTTTRTVVNRSAVPNTTSVSTALKRKMAPTGAKEGPVAAKRNILSDLNSPRPKNTPAKPRQKTIAAIHSAQQQRRSGGKQKQRRSQQATAAASKSNHLKVPPSENYYSAEDQPSQTSVSYDVFEEFISAEEKHKHRSSVIQPKAMGPPREKSTLNRIKTPSRIAKPVTPFKQIKPTRMMLRRLSENMQDLSSASIVDVGPRNATTRGAAGTTPGRSPGGNLSRLSPRNKLTTTTRDLPIIF